MENTNTELSNRTASFFSWIEFIGLIIFFTARFFFREMDWLVVLGLVLVSSGYCYKMYSDWKTGRRKAFRNRLILLIVAITVALLIGHIAGNKK